jgi:hypothetical protein
VRSWRSDDAAEPIGQLIEGEPGRVPGPEHLQPRCAARSCRARILRPTASSNANTGPKLIIDGGPIASFRRSTSQWTPSPLTTMRAIRGVASTTSIENPWSSYASARRAATSGIGSDVDVAKSMSFDGRFDQLIRCQCVPAGQDEAQVLAGVEADSK